MSLTSHQQIRANEAIEKIKEASKELTEVLEGSPEGHCSACNCPAFVWRLLKFPSCARDGCGHDMTRHEVA
jgi:hypothetical protein